MSMDSRGCVFLFNFLRCCILTSPGYYRNTQYFRHASGRATPHGILPGRRLIIIDLIIFHPHVAPIDIRREQSVN